MARPHVALIGLLALAGCRLPGEAGHDGLHPLNVLLVLVDDAGVECFAPYGESEYAMPRLERLAAEGVRFDAAHATPLCTPTRAELLTGRSGVRSYTDFSILHPEERSLVREFQDAGWATGVMGKWQLLAAEHYGERAGTGTGPAEAGFDEWCLWQLS